MYVSLALKVFSSGVIQLPIILNEIEKLLEGERKCMNT